MRKCVHLIIYGLVQGVGYRYSTLNYTKTNGILGYIRNTSDGAVEIVAEAEEKNLKDFINWCYNGVTMAQVKKIDVQWREATGEFEDFKVDF